MRTGEGCPVDQWGEANDRKAVLDCKLKQSIIIYNIWLVDRKVVSFVFVATFL